MPAKKARKKQATDSSPTMYVPAEMFKLINLANRDLTRLAITGVRFYRDVKAGENVAVATDGYVILERTWLTQSDKDSAEPFDVILSRQHCEMALQAGCDAYLYVLESGKVRLEMNDECALLCAPLSGTFPANYGKFFRDYDDANSVSVTVNPHLLGKWLLQIPIDPDAKGVTLTWPKGGELERPIVVRQPGLLAALMRMEV